jgi:hypothetical protein
MQWWMLGALVTLVLSFVGSLVAMVLAWRRGVAPSWRRCRCVAGDAGVAGLIVIGSSWG